MTARQDMTMSQLHAYYEEFHIESDPYAFVDEGYLAAHASEFSIYVNGMTGNDDNAFYVSPREARVLAWSLLEAADKAERMSES